MRSLRNWCTGRRPVHSFQKKHALAVALIAGAAGLLVPAPAMAQAAQAAQAAAVAQSPVGQTVEDFYKARNGAPLWLSPSAGDAAEQLISLLSTASIDGLDPQKYQPAVLETELQTALRKNKRKDVERADQALSEAFVAYVDDLRTDPGVGINWVDPQLKPTQPTALAALLQAAAAPSLSEYVSNHFPGSRLRLDSIARLFGETSFGPIAQAATAALEAAIFAACVAGAMILVRKESGQD